MYAVVVLFWFTSGDIVCTPPMSYAEALTIYRNEVADHQALMKDIVGIRLLKEGEVGYPCPTRFSE